MFKMIVFFVDFWFYFGDFRFLGVFFFVIVFLMICLVVSFVMWRVIL